MLARLLFYFLLVYGLTLVLTYLLQRQLQYAPNKSHPGSPADAGVPEMIEVQATTDDGYNHLSWFAAPKEPGAGIIILFHGNAGNISHRNMKARHFIDRGYGVFFCGYRGYGGNRGNPTEAGLYKDARACLRWLDGKGYKTGDFILYGESLGSGVATQMALEIQPRTLILEAPFSSATDVAKHRYFFLPVDALLKDKYDNVSKIKDIRTNLLIIHGDEDEVVHIDLGQRLFNAANHPKEFITINRGAHSDLYEHHAGHVITDWLEKQIAAGK